MKKNRGTTFTLAKYIASEYIYNFLVSFFFFFVMFLVNQLLVMAETLLEKHIPLSSVGKMLFYYTPYLIGMTFPFATLVSCLMSIGRFSSDNEIQAIRASGLRYYHIFKPLVIVSLILFSISLSMNSYFMYASAKKRNQLMFDIAYSKPEVIITPNSNTAHDDMVIYSGDIKDSQIKDLVIIDKDEAKNRRVILASAAHLKGSDQQMGVTEVNMDNVFAHSVPLKKQNEFDFAIAEKMTYNILLDRNNRISIDAINDPDKTIWMLLNEIKKLRVTRKEKIIENKNKMALWRYKLRSSYEEYTDEDYYKPQFTKNHLNDLQTLNTTYLKYKYKKIKNYFMKRKQTEFHKKLFMPIGCIVMTFLAFPLGMFAKRSGKSVGFILGILLSFVYWFMFMVFYILSRRADWAPSWFIWAPNILIFLIGNILYFIRLRE